MTDPSAYKRRLGLHEEPTSYGKHAPTECTEVVGHEWHRTFHCDLCGVTYYEPAEDMHETDSLQCAGNVTRILREEP